MAKKYITTYLVIDKNLNVKQYKSKKSAEKYARKIGDCTISKLQIINIA